VRPLKCQRRLSAPPPEPVDYFFVDAWHPRTPATALATAAGKKTAPAAEAPPATATTTTIGCGSPVGRRQYVQLPMAWMDYRQPLVNDVRESIAVVLRHAATCCPPPCRPISFTLDNPQPRTLGRRAIYVAAGAIAMTHLAASRQFCKETAVRGEGMWGGNAIIKRNRATGWWWAATPLPPDDVGAAAANHDEAAAAYHPPRSCSLMEYRKTILYALGGHLLWPLRAAVSAAAEARSTVPASLHCTAGRLQTARVHIGRQ